MSRSTKWVVASGALVLVLGVVVFLRGRDDEKEPQYVTAKVERGSVIGRVTATGTLSALVTVQVGAQVSGRISSLGADFNSRVKKGDVLATMDPSLFEATLAQTRANEKAAEGNLARARAQALDSERKLARTRQLAEQKLVAQADLEAAMADADMTRASIQAAEGSVAQARAARQQAEVNLTYTTIASPIDGTVISRAVDVGQTVAASLAAPTLFTIAQDLTAMQVDTNVAEADVGKLREGLEATFTVDAFPQRRFRGRIRQIRFAPQVVQNVVTYDAVIDVPNEELLLRPGMTANVTFIYAQVDDVLRVPNAALRFRLDDRRRDAGPTQASGARAGMREGARPGGREGGGRQGGQAGDAAGPGGPREGPPPGEPALARDETDGGAPPSGERRREGGRWRGEGSGGERTVWVLRDGAPALVSVRTGATDGSFTEIVSGLSEGELVIVDKQQAGSGGSAPGQGPPGGSMRGMRRMF